MIHESAFIEAETEIGEGTRVWHGSHIRTKAILGKNCVIGKNVYIDTGVIIGDYCKIQNNVSVYYPAKLANGVFIGPHVCFTNDKVPRSINEYGELKDISEWRAEGVEIGTGASIGANSTLLPGIKIGDWAMIAAGSTVTKDVPKHALVIGSPARITGYVCHCGDKLVDKKCIACNKLVGIND